jgi:hypothetical protein
MKRLVRELVALCSLTLAVGAASASTAGAKAEVSAPSASASAFTRHVDPFIGTDGTGHVNGSKRLFVTECYRTFRVRPATACEVSRCRFG